MNSRDVRLRLTRIEGAHLARIVEEFQEIVGSGRDTADPAVQRLTPTPYPDDTEASSTFADTTREVLLDRRWADAATVRSALTEFDSDPLGEDDALNESEVLVAEDQIDPWLRTLTAIRLVLASRLGIADDDEHDTEDSRFAVYDWLGYRLEVLIQAADALG